MDNSFKRKIFSFIKVLSTVLITSALGLELWNILSLLASIEIPSILTRIFMLERFALFIHLVEGLIAAAFAPAKNKMPIKTGVITFFVGTVGLVELFKRDD